MPKTLRKHIEVNVGDQILTAFEGNRLVYQYDCITGRAGHLTSLGIFSIIRKWPKYRSATYGNWPMDHAMFFTSDGQAIHEYYGDTPFSLLRAGKWTLGTSDPFFGSHGCVRLQKEDATTLYDWTPEHTEVRIFA